MFLCEEVDLPSLVQLTGGEAKNAVVTRKEVMKPVCCEGTLRQGRVEIFPAGMRVQ
jgi:hypothetical protein